jgi:hypothetical protein
VKEPGLAPGFSLACGQAEFRFQAAACDWVSPVRALDIVRYVP